MYTRPALFVILLSVVPLSYGQAQSTQPPAEKTAEKPVRLKLSPADIQSSRDYRYDVHIKGTKAGYMQTSRLTADNPANPGTYTAKVEMLIQLSAVSKQPDVLVVTEWQFDARPPYALKSYRLTETQGNTKKTITLTRGSDGYTALLEMSGKTRTKKPALDYTLEDYFTSRKWFQAPRRVGDSLSVRSLNGRRMKQTISTYKILSEEQGMLNGEIVNYYLADMRSGPRPEALVNIDEQGRLLYMSIAGGAVEMTLAGLSRKSKESK